MRFLTILMLVLCAGTVKSQHSNAIGIKTGATFSNQTWKYKTTNTEFQQGTLTGMHAVITAELFKGKYFSLVTDAGYTEKGHREKIYLTNEAGQQPGDAGTSTLEMKIGYLTFSPALKLTCPLLPVSPYLITGPQVDHRISYRSDYDASLKNLTEKTIFGYNAGVGAEYPVRNLTWLLEGRYHHDLTPLFDSTPSDFNTGLKITGRSVAVVAGVKYTL